jgi:hypothetical protein
MRKTLKNILKVGLTSLAFAGCTQNRIETLNGKFRGYDIEIQMLVNQRANNTFPNVIARRIEIKNPHSIVGLDSYADGIFEKVYFDGEDMGWLKPIRERLRNDPIFYLANSDSLNAAYDSVMAQNARGAQR